MRTLAVTAVEAERDAVAPRGGHILTLPGGYRLHRAHEDTGVDVLAGGVGPGAIAAATATALAYAALQGGGSYGSPYGLVVSAGIGGGFPPLPLGATVVSDAIVAADLGAQTADGGFAELGFGTVVHTPPKDLVRAAADAAGAVTGTVLSVSTVTGTAARARELSERHPGAAAEGMEGFGVAEAAAAYGLPALEVRAVSNAVGPRDKAAWDIPGALTALEGAFERLAPVLRTWQP
ncbi:futalosine hydrolase [Streptomyces sp. ODS28]|uniref:futalosine hydrolase n=1 Tax=Streptomyces sp. ODS28 TaxID=3136688 RepID=UPI0031E7B068